eukprot:TRINITY_DN7297_c0_g1_i1.p1 TRINITY_DN7297_c0_g1~~TRINITY_DN7297_c0_g1_i1.p1  ORF type:complete len:179 (+),score=14.41 TRINITY_DN7297_c0_g1_i1:36-539(+)
MDAIAGSLLYVMCESDAFQLLNVLMTVHFPLYFYSDKENKYPLIGGILYTYFLSVYTHCIYTLYTTKKHSFLLAYAGSHLAFDVLKMWDPDLFHHLSSLHPYQFLFPLIASFQAISQPLVEVQKLWDYLFAFGVYLNPIVAVSHLIVNKESTDCVAARLRLPRHTGG